MKQSPGLLLITLSLLFLLAPAASGELASELSAILSNKALSKTTSGVKVVRLGATPGETHPLFEHNAGSLLIPASNMKLLTTAAAIEGLGAGFKFRTLLVQRGNDLVLIGDGDPSFGDSDLLEKSGWTATTVFENWARQLKQAGLTKFNHVLVDDSVFDTAFFHPNWQAKNEQAKYQAQVGGVSLNLNCVELKVRPTGAGQVVRYDMTPPTAYVSVSNTCLTGRGSGIVLTRQPGSNQLFLRGNAFGTVEMPVTIHDPPMFALRVLAETLVREGIRIEGGIGRDRTVRAKVLGARPQAGHTLLAIHETPLMQVIERANKDSVNLYAESLCKRLGHARSGEPGTWKAGTEVIGAALARLGVDPATFRLDDGSGLSRENGVAVSALVRVLEHEFHSPHKEAWIASLAVAGEDGTLDNRFQNELRGRVFAKTGYIDNVRALSGYLRARNGGWYAFGILMNGKPLSSQSKSIQESILQAIDRHSGRES